jgi:hypothetical protein
MAQQQYWDPNMAHWDPKMAQQQYWNPNMPHGQYWNVDKQYYGVLGENAFIIKLIVKIITVVLIWVYVSEVWKRIPGFNDILGNPWILFDIHSKFEMIKYFLYLMLVCIVYVAFCKYVQYDGDLKNAILDSTVKTIPIAGHAFNVISCIFV